MKKVYLWEDVTSEIAATLPLRFFFGGKIQTQELFQRGWSFCPTPFTINLLYTKKRPQLGKISGAQKGGWPAAWWS